MGLFSKNSKQQVTTGQKSNGAISSIIAQEMHITGEIAFKGKARIDGTLEGDIKGEYLILSETGRIHGNLTLDTLVCHGSVRGDIQANTITAHPTASIRGSLTAGNLTVEPGAAIEGEIHAVNRTKPKPASKTAPVASQPAARKKASPAPAQTGQKTDKGK